MNLLNQLNDFGEYLGAYSLIDRSTLLLYYGILLLIYLLFLRGLKPTYLTVLVFLTFNGGFFESLYGNPGSVVFKTIIIALMIVLFVKMRLRELSHNERVSLHFFWWFTMIYFVGYLFNGLSILWAAYQYYKYLFPIALYYVLKSMSYSEDQAGYYATLVHKLLIFQILFSIAKLLILGFRENIVGSIANTGGSVGLVYAVLGIIIYWSYRKRELIGKDWLFVFSLLVMPIASNKRATWFIVPIILAILLTGKLTKTIVRNVAILILVLPTLIYVGFRLNPTLNPERVLWGSFDPVYALDYALSYSGVSEEKLAGEYAQGRWGAGLQILEQTIRDPFSTSSLLGWGRSRTGQTSEEFVLEDYGLRQGTMISGIGYMILQNGWFATLLLIAVFLHLIITIPDKRARYALLVYVLWDVLFYGGLLINNPTRSVFLIMSIWLIRYHLSQHSSLEPTLSRGITIHPSTSTSANYTATRGMSYMANSSHH